MNEKQSRALQRAALLKMLKWQAEIAPAGTDDIRQDGKFIPHSLQTICLYQQQQIEALASIVAKLAPELYLKEGFGPIDGWPDIEDSEEDEDQPASHPGVWLGHTIPGKTT